MTTKDETFTTCSVCSATTDLKKNNWGWDYCACLDANYCPSCSPTNTCACEQDGSCECANCAPEEKFCECDFPSFVINDGIQSCIKCQLKDHYKEGVVADFSDDEW